MKPSMKTTLSRKPQGETEACGVMELQRITDLCFYAFVLDVRIEVYPSELERILCDDARERIVREISKTTRMVAFITYHSDHMSLEITYSEGKQDVKLIRIRFEYSQRRLVLVSEAML
jgi:hypothetical protein